MNKKCLIIVVVLIGIGLILFSEKIYKLIVIKNSITTTNKEIEKNVTIIDVTGIKLGTETEHEHIYKTMYNEEKHWEECKVCNNIQNEVVHTYTTTWASGTENCKGGNYYTKSCTCGYSIQGKRPHVWTGGYVTSDLRHAKKCSVCAAGIGGRNGLYYKDSYGKGEIYNDENGPLDAYFYCYKSDGSKITCNNLGTCVMCKKTHTTKKHALMIDETSNKIFCMVCKDEFGTCYNNMTRDSNIPGTYIVTSNIELKNGATYDSIGGMPNTSGAIEKSNRTITNIDTGKVKFTLKNEIKLKTGWKIGVIENLNINILINGIKCNLSIMPPETLYPDIIKPIIGDISTENDVEWSKNKIITISGTENYCNTVKVKILDNENNTIFSGETTVNNGSYSISCTPDIEAGVEGRKFKVIVTDACENSTEQEFSISKIDAIPPEATSNAEVGGEWAKEKSFTAAASDHGIGNVQIAFNEVLDYQLATKNENEYTREYKLVGDVYQPTKARIFYKDELNNISSQEITIDKLDNTAPTITNASIHNNKLTVEANDIKEGMGEGSGVIKYRFMTSESKLENPEITKENSTEVSSNEDMIIPDIVTAKYVYIVAEDLVRK